MMNCIIYYSMRSFVCHQRLCERIAKGEMNEERLLGVGVHPENSAFWSLGNDIDLHLLTAVLSHLIQSHDRMVERIKSFRRENAGMVFFQRLEGDMPCDSEITCQMSVETLSSSLSSCWLRAQQYSARRRWVKTSWAQRSMSVRNIASYTWPLIMHKEKLK